MASQVTVIDTTARRAVVKVNPGTYLADVLQEGCKKLGLDSRQYGLKNNNKQVDLSRNFRLSGLTSGAKLELVLLSRSPSAVSVALQLPSESSDGASVRLVEKFASTTSIWMILRHFETANAQESRPARNLTARGRPRFVEGESGAGTLCHEKPVVQAMGRELSSLADLEKTLAQLGFNGGGVSLRLDFRETATPLEVAMDEMKAFFREEPGLNAQTPASPKETSIPVASAVSPADGNTGVEEPQNQSGSIPVPSPPASNTVEHENVPVSDAPQIAAEAIPSEPITSPSSPPSTLPNTTIAGRPVAVFQPPSTSTPVAASRPHNPADYEPTTEHARIHQALLNKSSHNKTLPSDAEIAAKEAAQAEKLSAIKDVEVKIRLPDQSSLVSRFGPSDTGPDLYSFVQGCLAEDGERFLLSFPGPKGRVDVPKQGKQKLISGLGMTGKVLVNFSWESAEGRERMQGRQVLKDEYSQMAKPIEVKEIEGSMDGVEQKGGRVVEKEDKGKGKEKGSGGIPKWLKLPGKK